MQAQDVFEILVREQADMLAVFVRASIRDAAAADDVFQETLLVAWRKLDEYDRTRPFGPWLRGIAAKLILAHHRQRSRNAAPQADELLERIAARCDALERRPGDTLDEKLDSLRDCVAALPEPYREAIDLRYRGELELPALAMRLAISLETAKKRLQRARARLLDCIQRKLATGETP